MKSLIIALVIVALAGAGDFYGYHSEAFDDSTYSGWAWVYFDDIPYPTQIDSVRFLVSEDTTVWAYIYEDNAGQPGAFIDSSSVYATGAPQVYDGCAIEPMIKEAFWVAIIPEDGYVRGDDSATGHSYAGYVGGPNPVTMEFYLDVHYTYELSLISATWGSIKAML